MSTNIVDVLNIFTDCTIYIFARIPGRDTRHLGSIPGSLSSIYVAQLAAGDHTVRAQPQGVAVLGQPEGPRNAAQVLEQKGDQLRPGRTVPRLGDELPVGARGPAVLPAGQVAVHDPRRSAEHQELV